MFEQDTLSSALYWLNPETLWPNELKFDIKTSMYRGIKLCKWFDHMTKMASMPIYDVRYDSVVECLTREQRIVGLRLTRGIVVCA